MIKKLCWIVFLSLSMTSLMAQDYDIGVEEEDGAPPKRGYRYSVALDVCAPHIFTNPANARAFDGIASVGANFNFRIVKGFSLGFYTRYTGYNVYNPILNGSNPLSTTLSGGLSMQYEVSLGARFAYIPSVNAGLGWIMYQNINRPPKDVTDSPRTTLHDFGFYIQQNNGFYYWARRNKRVGIGFILGFSYFSHEFNLKDTGMDGDSELNSRSDKGPTVSLNFGIGVVTNISKILGM